jgi:hypothetical protein
MPQTVRPSADDTPAPTEKYGGKEADHASRREPRSDGDVPTGDPGQDHPPTNRINPFHDEGLADPLDESPGR